MNSFKPEWQLQMENEAFRIAFPNKERIEGDSVEIAVDWDEGIDYGCDTCGSWPPSAYIQVKWTYPYDPTKEYQIQRPIQNAFQYKTFIGDDMVEFWRSLMRGSR